jgi:hypothetical protein
MKVTSKLQKKPVSLGNSWLSILQALILRLGMKVTKSPSAFGWWAFSILFI